ncbi:MAG: hypothetical protein K8W52_45600 [Deltaproteobacteria bacterium]|nr:hypothetical protein [Deltaproteobacteria bacterium]
MNKTKKKLTLRIDTVRVLDASKLADAAGGVIYSRQLLCGSGNAVCESWIACSYIC